MYKYNPKVNGSGIVCVIPQTGVCPIKCPDCFFQSGRSYLEPLEDNLPNMIEPAELDDMTIVRVNDGNDSNNQKELVINACKQYKHKFYNTSQPDLSKFDAPVVLTVNPSGNTDKKAVLLPYETDGFKNLMFVRIRANTWNIDTVIEPAIKYYTGLHIPVVLTFMAYYSEDSIPEGHRENYTFRQRTMNSYYAITTEAWKSLMDCYYRNPYVYSCTKVEGVSGASTCMRCGNCVREYHNLLYRQEN